MRGRLSPCPHLRMHELFTLTTYAQGPRQGAPFFFLSLLMREQDTRARKGGPRRFDPTPSPLLCSRTNKIRGCANAWLCGTCAHTIGGDPCTSLASANVDVRPHAAHPHQPKCVGKPALTGPHGAVHVQPVHLTHISQPRCMTPRSSPGSANTCA